MPFFVRNIKYIEKPDGVREMDGIVGTGCHRHEFAVFETVNEYGGEYNFLFELEPTTTPHRGYEHRWLTEEENKYPPMREVIFTRDAEKDEKLVEPQDSYYLPTQQIRVLCPCDSTGHPMKPIGSVSYHDITIWGQGIWHPEGKEQ